MGVFLRSVQTALSILVRADSGLTLNWVPCTLQFGIRVSLFCSDCRSVRLGSGADTPGGSDALYMMPVISVLGGEKQERIT